MNRTPTALKDLLGNGLLRDFLREVGSDETLAWIPDDIYLQVIRVPDWFVDAAGALYDQPRRRMSHLEPFFSAIDIMAEAEERVRRRKKGRNHAALALPPLPREILGDALGFCQLECRRHRLCAARCGTRDVQRFRHTFALFWYLLACLLLEQTRGAYAEKPLIKRAMERILHASI
jgi:hypothetical protein